MTESLLIVGAEGTLGSGLVDRCRREGVPVKGTMQHPGVDFPGAWRLDLTEPLNGWAPPACSAAVLCAAITSLEACRRDPEATRLVNVTQTLAVAERLNRAGVFVVFISSNLVFDGSKSCQAASDPLCPQTEYGRQKAEVERELRRFGDAVAVVRLTKVASPRWALVRGWVEALREWRTVEAYEDMVCAPIPVEVTLAGLMAVARKRLAGVWQFSAATDVSYADIACHLALEVGADPVLVRATRSQRELVGAGIVEPVPQHTVLDTNRAVAELGLRFPPPLEAVSAQFIRGGTEGCP